MSHLGPIGGGRCRRPKRCRVARQDQEGHPSRAARGSLLLLSTRGLREIGARAGRGRPPWPPPTTLKARLDAIASATAAVPALQLGILEDSHRPVPEHCGSFSDRLSKVFTGLRTNVCGSPPGLKLVAEEPYLALFGPIAGVWPIWADGHQIDGKNDPRIIGEKGACGVEEFGLDMGDPDLVTQRREKGEAHRPADEQVVHPRARDRSTPSLSATFAPPITARMAVRGLRECARALRPLAGAGARLRSASRRVGRRWTHGYGGKSRMRR